MITDQNVASSIWIATTPTTSYPTLKKNIFCDVVIIGGGISGITCAYLLKQDGKKVVLLEAERIVRGTTGYTTGKLTSLHNLIYSDLYQKFGKEPARLYGQGQQEALELVASLVTKYDIKCNFRRTPAYTYTKNAKNLGLIKQEVETTKRLGLPAFFVTKSDLPFPILGAVKFDSQAQFHPRKYLLKLADKISDNGSCIFENSPALEIKQKVCTVITENGKVKAKDIVVATNFPIIETDFFNKKLSTHHACAMALQIKGKIPPGMYINPETDVFSVRSQPYKNDEDLILTGDEDPADLSPTTTCQTKLLKKAQKYFNIQSVDFHWGAQDSQSQDKLPLIGRLKKYSHLFVITGFGGWGMTNGTLAGMIIKDQILGKDSPYTDLFDPDR